MIRFEELHVLLCYSFTALFVYHTTMYFMLTNRYRAPRRYRGIRWWIRGIATLLLILIGIGLVLTLGSFILADIFAGVDHSLEIVPFIYLIVGFPVLTQLVLAPMFGIYCYRNIEIES